MRQVRVLPEAVARKIAAGEVIDRPHAAVRELLDNAIDAGAREITLRLEGGGIDAVQVTDDGGGMDRDDLEVCWLPHATSKIETVDDLERVSTLGFRGEALSSLAACSRLEILSSRGGEAYRLAVHGGKSLELAPHQAAPGTTVSVHQLFFNMPARRKFLKSARAESGLCRRVFHEKAAAHPERTFRLFVDGVLKAFLPAGSPAERIAAAWPRLAPPGGWWETRAEGDGFSVTTVHARPENSRKDRQYIQIYTNRRRIDEYALVQAVQYAYDAWMPGGTFPVAFVFIEVDPSLVDFNIHPAKKEARFRDIGAIRHRLIESLKDRLTGESYRARADRIDGGSRQPDLIPAPPSESPAGISNRSSSSAAPSGGNYRSPGRGTPSAAAESSANRTYGGDRAKRPDDAEARAFAREAAQRRTGPPPAGRRERHVPGGPQKGAPFRYLGQAMGVFLIAESSGSLFMVDQHAAHERILFERYRSAPPESEQLLIPRPLDLDRAAMMRLELRKDRLKRLGLVIEPDAEDRWHLTAMPRVAAGMEDAVIAFIEEGAGDAEGLEKDFWADLACKAAVKDNSVLDDESARELLEAAFALETPRCPHGRPIWFEVSRKELFELVGRDV